MDEVGEVRYFICGPTCDSDIFLKKLPSTEHEKDLDCGGFFIKEGSVFRFGFEEGYFECNVNFSDSLGSGSAYAISAIDHGKSAKEAVEYAMTRDCYTGGEVMVYKV